MLKNVERKLCIGKKTIIILSVVLALALFEAWDIVIDPPAFWRTERIQDKRAILAYVNEKYPDAVQTKRGEFPLQMPAGTFKNSVMYFKFDDIEFAVSAKNGQIVIDGYSGARAIAQFDKIIQDGFLKPRGITAYTSYQFVDNYYEIYPYTGGLLVDLTIFDQGSTPREVGWLYDFYKYWKDEGGFLRLYAVKIDIIVDKQRKCHINFLNDDDFSGEEKFYSAFKAG